MSQQVSLLITMNKDISFMLYKGLNLYATVRLPVYISLQLKIELLCCCLNDADTVLSPSTL